MDIQFDITFIVEIVFALIGLVVMRYIYPWLKSNMSVKQQQELNEIFDVIVAAAQQLFGGSGRGAERKEYALNCLEAWLSSKGIKLDADKLDAMLEAAVYRLKSANENQNSNIVEEPQTTIEEIVESAEPDEGNAEEYEVPAADDMGNAEERESCAE